MVTSPVMSTPCSHRNTHVASKISLRISGVQGQDLYEIMQNSTPRWYRRIGAYVWRFSSTLIPNVAYRVRYLKISNHLRSPRTSFPTIPPVMWTIYCMRFETDQHVSATLPPGLRLLQLLPYICSIDAFSFPPHVSLHAWYASLTAHRRLTREYWCALGVTNITSNLRSAGSRFVWNHAK